MVNQSTPVPPDKIVRQVTSLLGDISLEHEPRKRSRLTVYDKAMQTLKIPHTDSPHFMDSRSIADWLFPRLTAWQQTSEPEWESQWESVPAAAAAAVSAGDRAETAEDEAVKSTSSANHSDGAGEGAAEYVYADNEASDYSAAADGDPSLTADNESADTDAAPDSPAPDRNGTLADSI